MKKILLMAVMAAVCMMAKVSNEEESLRGCYFVAEEFDEVNGWDDYPLSISFENDGTCVYTNRNGTLVCLCYIVNEDCHKIHFFSNTQFNGDEKLNVINLSIGGHGSLGHTEGNWLMLGAFDKSGWVQMRKQDKPSSVKSVTTDRMTTDNNTKYSLNGIVVESPQGLYIQAGKKKVAK